MTAADSGDFAALPAERSMVWRWAVCAILLGATLINYANRGTLTQNALRVQQEFKLNEKQYGEINARFSYGFAAGAVVFGILADVVSVRWLYPAVVLVWSAAGFANGLARDGEDLLWSQTLLGLFEAGHWPCALRTTQRVFLPAQRTLGNSLLQSGASLGAIGTPLLILALTHWYPEHWRWSFYLVGLVGIPWAMAWLALMSEADVTRPVIQTDDSGLTDGELAGHEPPWWMLFLGHRWWLLLFTVLCINTVWHYVRVWLPIILGKQHGYSDSFVQVFTSVYYAFTFVGSVAAGWLTARLAKAGWTVFASRIFVFGLCASLTALSVPAAFLPAGWPMLGCLLLVAFGSLGLFPVYYSFTQELSAAHQGKVGGSLGFLVWIVMAYIHELVGKAVDADPSVRPYILAAVGIAPLVGCLALGTLWGRRTVTERVVFEA